MNGEQTLSAAPTSPAFITATGAEPRRIDWREWAGKTVILAGSALILYAAATHHARTSAFGVLRSLPFGPALIAGGGIYAGLCAAWSTWRLILAIRYRPTPNARWAELPRLSVIVPVFNEAGLIGATLRHLSRAEYPAELLEIIVIDDGSSDESWSHIHRAAELDSRIRPLRLERNRGKRHALNEGFRRARGDFWVTVDSDSLIEPDALRAIVSPMVADASVGAVAGSVRVLNKGDGLIPLMLDVRYAMTFDYKRAAQGMMDGGSVLCVAGALAAYRRSVVEPHLADWLDQTWLGRPARAGEDHAMTNVALRAGCNVRYQRTAVVHTQSPTSYGGIARMFLRWGRSNVRETVQLGHHLSGQRQWLRRPLMSANYLMGAIGLVLPYLLLMTALAMSCFWPATIGLKLLAACISGAVFPAAFYAAVRRDTNAVYAFAYSLYATLLLFWVWPYALITSHKSVWMTRTSPPLSSGHGLAASNIQPTITGEGSAVRASAVLAARPA